jgi:IS605 OrfB family transposase
MLNNQAVQYRFKRAKDGYSWYLDVILQRNRTIKANSREFQSLDKEEAFLKNRKYAYIDDTYFENTKLSGMIGVDMNDGFLSATYLSKKEEYERSKDLFFTTEDSSTKNKERLLTHISELVKEAKELNYGIAIEDLDFTKKKRAKNGKARNRMLHNFATRRCREAFESACSKNNVRFFIVSPAYTTRIGRKLYAPKYEISVHQAAALTIALRAMGKQFDVEEYK